MLSEMGEVRSLPSRDGLRLAYRFFPSQSEPCRGAIVHVHGIQSHSGWYVETAAELQRNGYSVYLLDRRGSGLSEGLRGFTSNRREILDDLGRFVDLAKSSHPDVPAFLVGCCWGAMPAAALALHVQAKLAGLILVSPALGRVKVEMSRWNKAKILLGHLVWPRWRVPVPLSPELFTRNPIYQRFIREDGLALKEATARFYFETLLLRFQVIRPWHRLTLPMLVLQSNDDPIIDDEGARDWARRISSGNARVIVYQGFGHILDFNEDRQRYWNDLTGWLGVVASGSPSRAAG